jgi:hypothetical protein
MSLPVVLSSGRNQAALNYVPPFDVIKQLVDLSASNGQLVATASYDNLMTMIKLLLSAAVVDENWYLANYPDVAEAISKGTVASARRHFIDDGYFEGRLPFGIAVDETWYRSKYPDVAESIMRGTDVSGQAHFFRSGYKEGRMPSPA